MLIKICIAIAILIAGWSFFKDFLTENLIRNGMDPKLARKYYSVKEMKARAKAEALAEQIESENSVGE